MDNVDSGRSISYSYDALYRLASATDLAPESAGWIIRRLHLRSVYPPRTSVRRFCCFYLFGRFIESVSYAVSIHAMGSNPTRASRICPRVSCMS